VGDGFLGGLRLLLVAARQDGAGEFGERVALTRKGERFIPAERGPPDGQPSRCIEPFLDAPERLFGGFGAGEIGRRISPGALKGSEALGLLLFIGTAAAAFGFGGTFFANWLANGGAVFGNVVPFGPNPGDLNTGGVIPLMNLAVGIEVLGALSVIVMLMFKGVGREETE